MVKSKINNLKQLLSKSIEDETAIIDHKVTLLTAGGEHYGSIMLALDVTIKKPSGESEVLNLVAKLLPASDILRIAFNVLVTFKKEVIAYTVCLPALLQLQREYNVPNHNILDIFPKCYGARVCLDENKNQVDDDAVLVFENLKLQGYETEDRLVGLDLESAKIIVQDLARFHSVSLAFKLLKPEEFKAKIMTCLVKNELFENVPEEMRSHFRDCILRGSKAIPELRPYLYRIQAVVDASATPYEIPPPNELFATISHSDFWSSNTMIKKDKDGKPIKNKIVDLQLMTYDSVCRDLIFFILTSIINSQLDDQFDNIIRLYYDTFIDGLRDYSLELTPFSWEAFQKELNEVAPTEVFHILSMLKPICTERGRIKENLEDFKDTDLTRSDLLGSHYIAKLRDTVLELVKRRWI